MERGRGRGRGRVRGGPGSATQTCYSCGGTGHFARDCPAKKQGGSSGNRNGIDMSSGDYCNGEYVPGNAEVTATYIDTHVHWEYVLTQLQIFQKDRRTDYADFLMKTKMPHNFEGSISIFCDPAAFSSLGQWPELLAEKNIWGAFGCHPHNAKYYNEAMVERISGIFEATDKAVAWGECGLDYKKNMSTREQQISAFTDQVKRAQAYGKPLVIHSRDAEEDTRKVLSENLEKNWHVHVHSYSDSSEQATWYLQEFPNAYFGLTGSLCFENANALRKTVKDVIPLNRILFETDGPYMTPPPYPQRYIPVIAQKVAELKEVTLEEVFKQVRENTRDMYGI